MGLKNDLETAVGNTFRTAWARRDGKVVPQYTDLKMTNDAVDLDCTMLYADLSDSTVLVDRYKDEFAAEIYKTFLTCAARIINSEGGEIRSYDGDRVMAIYIGGSKNTSAARSALKIHYAVKHIIEPKMKEQYTSGTYVLKHVVGIDTSKAMAIRTGVRGDNDLAWIGKSPNYAAKLSSQSDSYQTWISEAVYNMLHADLKYSSGTSMWTSQRLPALNNMLAYRSTYWWRID